MGKRSQSERQSETSEIFENGSTEQRIKRRAGTRDRDQQIRDAAKAEEEALKRRG